MSKERKARFRTLSDIELKSVYGPEDLPYFNELSEAAKREILEAHEKHFGAPGKPPFLRGIYELGYRAQLPTIRQFCGRGTAEDTNELLHYLISLGETGVSIAYDAPTLYARDSDNEDWSFGYVGKDGVAVDTFADYKDLFRGIQREKFAVSQTINLPAIVFFCMDLLLAKEQKINLKKLRGTIQSDMRKEAIGQKAYRFSLTHGMRLEGDMMEFAIRNLDFGFYPVNSSGYHMSEQGASSAQELTFTFENAFVLLEYCLSRGMNIDDVAGRMSCFFNCKGFWEEIAKFRAARKIWYETIKSEYGAKNPRSLALKFHVQNSGASFKRQEPRNNVIRGSLHYLAAFLGGAQSIHLNSWDEEMALPSVEAVKEAIRTQQIVGEEMNIADVVDAVGGSYYLEWHTREIERRVKEYFGIIDKLGGMQRAIELGYPQLEIKKTSLAEAERTNQGSPEIVIVGVNKHFDLASAEREEKEIFDKMIRVPTLETHQKQKERLAKVKRGRDERVVEKCLKRLADEARGGGNLVEPVTEAVGSYATVEETMIKTLEPVFGRWRGPGD
ncbi:hypothetical protein A3G55_04095 [Candidatus Giovannonibacteria bacterium RIFCSPLOWO2_12_FULL_44_25]|uniref:Methylmalonyl-CoA mutase family protein n=3 Tax=Candidatus Giovannoniibacteriota TaxID=1752738 RepID=A0A0G1IC57_9BACT|nr:MAG: Methylmalonyl-CoA mutase family protein [Parcubacteria group bacterium GW2011_GWC1_44_10]KKT56991.1 MAG: Methylmalonyl-CoA mutase family protein [Candidatus Giovannonibacteria bacterium GW2011_GWB1_44_23]KKT59602.1 MAG: Methylmalonyl-CoA mutase family protein [Candidatus Giovannonibacteria bacterium GW2011_GWA1_44_25]OGF49854.1 MAG: hypothetical protein A2120_01380 [Candidatus Giovannonibacteria bacterium GWA2_45_15]OGF59397.1 MAG: hypothetical protein A2W40_02480 [Candidatus Giovannoni